MNPSPTQAAELAQERVLMFTLAGIQFAHILDFMIMMPLGPMLMQELHINAQQFALLVSAYTFAAAFAGVAIAFIADRVERKRLLLGMFALFSASTLACALATDHAALLTARALAGAFGGALGSVVHTMVGDLIPFERRGRASGVIMSAFSLSTIAGVPASLYLANLFGWRAPFVFIAALAIILLWLAHRSLPELRAHLTPAATPGRWFGAISSILADGDQRLALLFMSLLMIGGFTVIPFITIYATANVGIRQQDIPLLYLAGGAATFFSARRIGRLADRYGKARVYRYVAVAAVAPLLALTHLPPAPLWMMILVSTAFFVFVSGRMTPALAILTSVPQPRSRGAFLSLVSAVQNLSSGAAAWLGGVILSLNAQGQVQGYDLVGWLAAASTLASIVLVGRIRMTSAAPALIPGGPDT